MTISIVAFARIREIIGRERLARDAEPGATAGDVWMSLAREYPALDALGRSTRLVRNGAFAEPSTALVDGDELGLLPPFGGG